MDFKKKTHLAIGATLGATVDVVVRDVKVDVLAVDGAEVVPKLARPAAVFVVATRGLAPVLAGFVKVDVAAGFLTPVAVPLVNGFFAAAVAVVVVLVFFSITGALAGTARIVRVAGTAFVGAVFVGDVADLVAVLDNGLVDFSGAAAGFLAAGAVLNPLVRAFTSGFFGSTLAFADGAAFNATVAAAAATAVTAATLAAAIISTLLSC